MDQSEYLDWGRRLAQTGHEMGLLSDNQRVISALEGADHEEMRALTEKVYALMNLIVSLPGRFHSGSIKAFAHAIKLPHAACALIEMFGEELSADVFARADFIRSGNGWKLVEINAGSSVGGLTYTSLPRLAGFRQKYDVLAMFAQTIVQRYGIQSEVAYIEDMQHIDIVRKLADLQAKEISKCSGAPVSILGTREIEFKSGALFSKVSGQRIDFVLPLFNDLDLYQNQAAYEPLLSALQNRKVTSVMGPINRILGSKGVFAYLFEKIEFGQLTSTETELVHDLVPTTIWVDQRSTNKLLNARADWVIKPASGFCGTDVSIGKEKSAHQWEEIVRSGKPGMVAQRLVHNPAVMVKLTDRNGVESEQETQLVWGPFQIGSRYIGCFVRGSHVSRSAVINHFNGAEIGPIPPADGRPI